MKRSTLLKTGITGAVVSVLCCFTPVLVVLFGALGFAAGVGYLDYILMPSLLFFVGLIIYAVMREEREKEDAK